MEIESGNLRTLWDDAFSPEQIPPYPRYQLLRATGGEPTYEIRDAYPLGNGKERIIVQERPAELGELIRDPQLRFIPDWTDNFAHRLLTEHKWKTNPRYRSMLAAFCKSDILYFINTFGWCFDPRRTRNRRTPFCTFEFQDDAITNLLWLIKYGRGGVWEKSRDMGASWMCVAVSAWLSVFYEDTGSLFMSMRENDVDDRSMDSLLGKLRFFLNNLPSWMRGGWQENMQGVDTVMDISFPGTDSKVKGILSKGTAGRSGRSTICFNDEFAFVENSSLVLSALSELSNSKLYLSTPNGTGGEFYKMANSAGVIKKTFHWTKHPLKTTEWARLRKSEPDMSEEIWAQEHEIAYETSVIGRVFPEFISIGGQDVLWPHVQDGDLVRYEPQYDTYDTSDLGISDPCSSLWFQIKPMPPHIASALGVQEVIVFFEEHQARNMTAFDLRYLINEKGYHYRDHILDMRTATQRDSSGKTWMKNMEDQQPDVKFSTYFRRIIDPGKPIKVKGLRSPEKETIQQMRNVLNHDRYAVVFSKHGCPEAIRAMQNWSFDLDKDTRRPKRNDSPRHDQYSHFCKAILYAVDWLYGKTKRPEEQMEEWDFRVLPRVSGI